jgi:nitroreductase
VFTHRVNNPNIVSKPALTAVPIDPILQGRFSPRVFDPEHVLPKEQILALAEAARWAPSASNTQPWNFAFLVRGSEIFDAVVKNGLIGFNQAWAHKASILVVVMSEDNNPDGTPQEPKVTHYNLGLASAHLVFQAESMKLRAHYMTGIMPPEIDAILKVAGFSTFSVIAVGIQAGIETVSEELQTRELSVRDRKDITQIVSHGL